MDDQRLSNQSPPPSRRHLLKCSAWAGTGVGWALYGGIPKAFALDGLPQPDQKFLFVQISDSHIGFNKAANPDPIQTLNEAKEKIRGLVTAPSLILHTGDITHLSTLPIICSLILL